MRISRIVLVCLLPVTVSCWSVAQTKLTVSTSSTNLPSVETRIDSLVRQWDTRDGAESLILGPALATEFVHEPTAFLSIMEKQPESFKSWVDDLDASTFTVFSYNSATDSIRLDAQHRTLRDTMLTTAKKMQEKPHLREMANYLAVILKRINIRFVD